MRWIAGKGLHRAVAERLITIPERVHQGDFVLELAKGVTQADKTLRDYVVTPQLVDAFNNALGFIQQAVLTGGSKAAYLHGSFGSGKSHFMAVLRLLLAGNTQARATPELAEVVARHSWTDGRKFLLVPYHMVGSRDMESAILGRYAEFVRVHRPEAPVPGFYLAEGMFEDARELRDRMGDDSFFAKLNEGTSPRTCCNPDTPVGCCTWTCGRDDHDAQNGTCDLAGDTAGHRAAVGGRKAAVAPQR